MPPSSQWPNYPTNPPQAWELLHQIVFEAHANAAPNFDLIVYLAFKCAANQTGTPADADHLKKVEAAHIAAMKRQWGIVAYELDHD